MTLTECWNAICLHYGKPSMVDNKPVRIPRKYDDTIGKDVAEWMRDYRASWVKKHPDVPHDFQPLFDKLKETYSVSYKMLPDRAKLQAASDALESIRGTSGELVSHRVGNATESEGQAVLDGEAIAAGIGEVMMIAKHGKSVERRSPYKED